MLDLSENKELGGPKVCEGVLGCKTLGQEDGAEVQTD
jgi:hypothetical protein